MKDSRSEKVSQKEKKKHKINFIIFSVMSITADTFSNYFILPLFFLLVCVILSILLFLKHPSL